MYKNIHAEINCSKFSEMKILRITDVDTLDEDMFISLHILASDSHILYYSYITK